MLLTDWLQTVRTKFNLKCSHLYRSAFPPIRRRLPYYAPVAACVEVLEQRQLLSGVSDAQDALDLAQSDFETAHTDFQNQLAVYETHLLQDQAAANQLRDSTWQQANNAFQTAMETGHEAFESALLAANNTYDTAVAGHQTTLIAAVTAARTAQADVADQIADSWESSRTTADLALEQAHQQANAARTSSLATARASFEATVGGATDGYESTVSGAESTFDQTVAGAEATFAQAESTAWDSYVDTTEDLRDNLTTLLANARANRDQFLAQHSGISIDPALIASDPDYLADIAQIDATLSTNYDALDLAFELDVTGAESDFIDQTTTAAGARDGQAEAAETAFDSATTAAEDAYDSALDAADADFDDQMDQAEDEYEGALSAAETTFDTNVLNASTAHSSALTSAESAFDGEARAAVQGYIDFLTEAFGTPGSYDEELGEIPAVPGSYQNAVRGAATQASTTLSDALDARNAAYEAADSAYRNSVRSAATQYVTAYQSAQSTLDAAVTAAGQQLDQSAQQAYESYIDTEEQIYSSPAPENMDEDDYGQWWQQIEDAINSAKKQYAVAIAQAQLAYTQATSAAYVAATQSERSARAGFASGMAEAEYTRTEKRASAEKEFVLAVHGALSGFVEAFDAISKNYAEQSADAYMEMQQSLADAERTFEEAVAEANSTYEDSLKDAVETGMEQAADADSEYVDALADALSEQQEDIANAGDDYLNAITTAQSDWKLADAAGRQDYTEAVGAAYDQLTVGVSAAEAEAVGALTATVGTWESQSAAVWRDAAIRIYGNDAETIAVVDAWLAYDNLVASHAAGVLQSSFEAMGQYTSAVTAAAGIQAQAIESAVELLTNIVSSADAQWFAAFSGAIDAIGSAVDAADAAWLGAAASAFLAYDQSLSAAGIAIVGEWSNAESETAQATMTARFAAFQGVWSAAKNRFTATLNAIAAQKPVEIAAIDEFVQTLAEEEYAYTVAAAARQRDLVTDVMNATVSIAGAAAQRQAAQMVFAAAEYVEYVSGQDPSEFASWTITSGSGSMMGYFTIGGLFGEEMPPENSENPITAQIRGIIQSYDSLASGLRDGTTTPDSLADGSMYGNEGLMSVSPETIAAQIVAALLGGYYDTFWNSVDESLRGLIKGNGWEVHHIFQQSDGLAGFLKQWKPVGGKTGVFDVDDVSNLVGVPDYIHDEISNQQDRWWRARYNALGKDPKAFSIKAVIDATPDKKQLLQDY